MLTMHILYTAPNPVDMDTIKVLTTKTNVKITWKVRTYVYVIYYVMQKCDPYFYRNQMLIHV